MAEFVTHPAGGTLQGREGLIRNPHSKAPVRNALTQHEDRLGTCKYGLDLRLRVHFKTRHEVTQQWSQRSSNPDRCTVDIHVPYAGIINHTRQMNGWEMDGGDAADKNLSTKLGESQR